MKEGGIRPTKATLTSTDAVNRVLSKVGRLKRTEQYRVVFLSADKTVEEEAEPYLYNFIKNDQ